jgi:hypothetical protein
LFVVALVELALAGVNHGDEAWFLAVASRVARGDVLYRDVFFGSTPLAVWLTLPAVAIAGTEIMAVKAIVAFALAAQGTGLVVAAVLAGLSERWALLLGLAVTVFAARYPSAAYTPLAVAGAVWTAAATLAYLRTHAPVLLAAAGACAGVAMAAKYTVGIVALLIPVVAAPRLAARPLVTASGVVVASLVPVAVTGGWPRFVEYAFAAKGTYVDVGRVSYFAPLKTAAVGIGELLTSPGRATVAAAVSDLAVWAPTLAMALLAVAWLKRPDRRPALAVAGGLLAAALAAAVPRFDLSHFLLIVSGPAFALAVAVHALSAGRKGVSYALFAVTCGIVLVCLAGNVPNGSSRFADLAGVRGVLVEDSILKEWRDNARDLTVARQRFGPVMVVSNDAGLRYVLAGVANPTPFDFPLATAFGHDGEDAVARSIAVGTIKAVCLDLRMDRALRPERLAEAVRRHLRPRQRIGECRLFTRT